MYVAGDSARTAAAARQWIAVIPWDAIRQVELREDDMKAIHGRGRRGALVTGVAGAAIGALVVPKSRVGGAVGVGLATAWLGYIMSAQGATVSTEPCWRLLYDRDQARARIAAGQPPHLGREGPRTCPT
jgi:hypothetical protein